MIDLETLKLIKENKFSEGTAFSEDMHRIIHDFYKNFDLDRQDSAYRETYIRDFIEQHEAFIVNYLTNIYNPHLKATDKLSDELTFCKFLSTLALYLTKYHEEQKV